MAGVVVISGGLFFPACATHQSNQERSIQATAHIESPIRTLEARAELEITQPWGGADDELLAKIVPDARAELAAGSPAYQRALTDPADIPIVNQDGSDAPSEPIDEETDPRRKTQATKLYVQARALKQTGQIRQATELLSQAAVLDPHSGTIQRELGETRMIANDRIGAINAYKRAVELGDRSPRVLIHLAEDASNRDDQFGVMRLSRLALASPTINREPMARSIASVLLGTAEINAGYLKAGALTLGDALESFDTSSREIRWKREIIQIMSQRAPLWILVGDAWASIGAHKRALDAFNNAGLGADHPPLGLLARQIASALRQGHPSNATLLFLDHLQNNPSDLGPEEIAWARTLSSIDGIGSLLGGAVDKLIARPGLPPSLRRSLLRVEINALDIDAAIERLGVAGLDANDPMIALDLLGRIDSETARGEAAASILETNPGIARAIASGLIRTLENPVRFLESKSHPETPAAQLLIGSIGIGLGRPDLIGHLDGLALPESSEQSIEWIGVHAQASALTGRWSQAQALIAELASRSDGGDALASRTLASTLLIAQQPARAWSLIREQANTVDASIEDLVLGAQIARSLEDYDSATNLLERAMELDGFDEKIYEQIFVLRSSSSPVGDEQELQLIVRQLATTRPRSPLYSLIRVNELARNGLVDEAEAKLIELNTASPYREIGYDLLLSIWKTKQSQEHPQALVDGIAWLEARQVLNPNSTQGLLAIAQGLFELEAHARSLALLEAGYERTGSFEIARAIEQLLGGPMDRADDARRHAVDRLENLVGIDPTLEYAGLLARQRSTPSTNRLVSVLNARLPADIELLPGQRAQLEQIVFTIAGSIESLSIEREMLELLSIIEAHSGRLDFQLARIKLILLSQQAEIEIPELVDVVRLALSQEDDADNRNTLRILPIQSLLSDDRIHEAIVFSTLMSIDGGSLDEDAAMETYQLLAETGTNTDLIGVLEKLDASGLMDEMIALTTQRIGTPSRKPAVTPDEQRSELAYTAAALTIAFDRPEQANSYYELALSYNPNHPWANNDYGYMLAEKGERMEEALEMLERAARLMPDEASVIDSLGWVRYKIGIFDDTLDADGTTKIPGAISLLTRANRLDTKRENATISLHLGDALWRGGYTDRAIDAWLAAEDILRARIRLISLQPNPNQRAKSALSIELKEVRTRLQDAASSGKPMLAPLVTPSAHTGNEE